MLQPVDDEDFREHNVVLKSQERILFFQVIRPTFAQARVFLLIPAHCGGNF